VCAAFQHISSQSRGNCRSDCAISIAGGDGLVSRACNLISQELVRLHLNTFQESDPLGKANWRDEKELDPQRCDLHVDHRILVQ
jgi:prolyl oligopeptidase PreP (S9A serine peptidase family)